MKTLIHGDCLTYLRETDQRVKAIFMDPPDNLGLSYDGYSDGRLDYYDWLELIIRIALQRTSVLWCSVYHKHLLELSYRLRCILRQSHPAHTCRVMVWRFTFGQHRYSDFASGYRPIIRIVAPNAPVYMDERIESVRQQIGDKRANPDGRVPDDVWDFPRVVGNAEERRDWHPTQHPEALMRRIINYSCRKDETFLDLFLGTGTSFRVREENVIGIEQSEKYCQEIAKEHGIMVTEA